MAQSNYAKVPLQDADIAPSAPSVVVCEQQGHTAPPQVYDPPPPYEAGFYPPPQGYQPNPVVAPPPQHQVAAYVPPHQLGHTPVVMQQQAATAPVVYQQPVAPTVIVTQTLAPGVCSVCRKGKIEDSTTCCTYFCCLLGCIFGCIPGIIAYFCCCRKPKCTHCGYTVN
ncbi:hypothetical protein SK128_014089 [Halocaridina rubra]|uniref:Membrane protein BRI3 n=1 Tax=Halocaridina rubra TaxID=373956 RepID=A0AAN8XAB9_HALRR